jgi:hypothetical protein
MTIAVPEHASALPTRTRVRVPAVGGAVLSAVTVWLVAVPVLGVELLVRPGPGPQMTVTLGPVVAVSLAVGAVLIPALPRSKARR